MVVTLIDFIGGEAIFAIWVEAFVTTKDGGTSCGKARVFGISGCVCVDGFRGCVFWIRSLGISCDGLKVVVGRCDAHLIAVVADFVVGGGSREVEAEADELNEAHAGLDFEEVELLLIGELKGDLAVEAGINPAS